MKRINFNKDWQFTYDTELDAFSMFGLTKNSEGSGGACRFYDYNNWQKIDLPHDFALPLPKCTEADTMRGGRPTSHYGRYFTEGNAQLDKVYNVGWYRKDFFAGDEFSGKRVFVEFEGVFRDSIVWVNGAYIDRHNSGYTGFVYEITDYVIVGEDNSIAVRVDVDQPEGWWYEGAGIYRNVWLHLSEPVYLKHNKTFVRADVKGQVEVGATVVNDTAEQVRREAVWQVLDADGRVVSECKTEINAEAYSEVETFAELAIENPELWSLEKPYLYTMRVILGDEYTVRFGVRELLFDADRGFFLNGKHVKLNGACVHQDFGGVGVALTDNLHRYKIQLLKEMGVNAYRCSHNPPAPALLDACDELGMLVMNETRMFGSAPEAMQQLTDLVERDRNHPSVIIWSIGNEEFTVQNQPHSATQADKMCRLVKRLDPTRLTTYGGNNRGNFTGINSVVDVRGINYIHNGTGNENWVETYHTEHPHQPIIGSEESSYVLSRGSDKNDFGSGILDCTGDVTMPWGSTPGGWVRFYEARPFMLGGFMWTGFDYGGESNPFCYTNFSSSFGTIDLCGMPKPPFYYYKSWWTDEPVLKLAPHWNGNVGEEQDVLLYTNCECVTVYLNGNVVGEYTPTPLQFIRLKLTFEPGELRAEGVKNGKRYTDILRTAGKCEKVSVHTALSGECEDDISIFELRGEDADGVFCPLASNTVEVSVEGGRIVGVGNGDPSDDSPEQLIPEEQSIRIRTFCCDGKMFKVQPKVGNKKRGRCDYLQMGDREEYYCEDFRNVAVFSDSLDKPIFNTYTVRACDLEGYEYIEFERFGGKAAVYLNGEKLGDNYRIPRADVIRTSRPYRFPCKFTEGVNEIRVEVEHDKCTEPFSGYIKVGRLVQPTYSVKLHYGRARVFVMGHGAAVCAKL